MFRRNRETMIALRARHEALEVTRDIAYPALEVPPPPVPAIRVVREVCYELPPPPPRRIEYRYEPAPEPTTKLGRCLMSDLVLSITAIAIGVGLILLCKYG